MKPERGLYTCRVWAKMDPLLRRMSHLLNFQAHRDDRWYLHPALSVGDVHFDYRVIGREGLIPILWQLRCQTALDPESY